MKTKKIQKNPRKTQRNLYKKMNNKKNKEKNNNLKMKNLQVTSFNLILLAKFKTYRRVLFVLGKTVKYSLWATFAVFLYHMYLIKKLEKPETGYFASDTFLRLAKNVDWHIYDLTLLLTRPPVEKLLPDRPPLPPGTGAAYPKTLILNLRGTIVHSEYKVIHF